MNRLSTCSIGTALTAVLFGLAGCQTTGRPLFSHTTADTQQDAANVYVTNYPAIPWNDIADKLEPKHNLTTETARTLAAVTTQSQVSQFLSSFASGLGIGLPTKTYLQSTTTSPNGLDSTTTTRSSGTGSVPGSSGNASTTIGDAALAPDLTKGPPALNVDANTALIAGTAVYQLAAILDNQISKAVYPSGYQAHLLTFQVNLQPRLRTSPYDVYIDLVLSPAKWKEAVAASTGLRTGYGEPPPVMVYPLVIADALETTSAARSVELIRQAALSLSGIVGRIGVNAGFSSGTDDLDAVIGQVRNSIVTVGRVSDHALRVRIGAQTSAESRYAMVPRSFNVSVVVLTRWPDSDKEKDARINSLSVFADTELADVETGVVLPVSVARSRPVLASETEKAVDGLGFAPITSDQCGGILPENKASAEDQTSMKEGLKRNQLLDILRAADRQDFGYLNKCLRLARAPTATQLPEVLEIGDRIRLERLLSRLSQLQANAGNAKMHVTLKPRDDPQLPPKQLFALATDTTSISATLRGGAALRADQIEGKLVIDGADPILPKSLTVKDRSEVTTSFPSFDELGLKDTDLVNPRVVLAFKSNPSSSETYKARGIASKSKDPSKPPNALSVAQSVLVPNDNGEAQVSVRIGEITGLAGGLRLRVDGADLRDDPAGLKVAREGGIDVSQKSVARLFLGNLTPLRDVTVTAFKKDPKSGDEVAAVAPIVLRVAR